MSEPERIDAAFENPSQLSDAQLDELWPTLGSDRKADLFNMLDYPKQRDIIKDKQVVDECHKCVEDYMSNSNDLLSEMNDPELEDTFKEFFSNRNNLIFNPNRDTFIQSRTPGNIRVESQYTGGFPFGSPADLAYDPNTDTLQIGSRGPDGDHFVILNLGSLNSESGVSSINLITNDYSSPQGNLFSSGLQVIDINGEPINIGSTGTNTVTFLPTQSGESIRIDSNGESVGITATGESNVNINGNQVTIAGNAQANYGTTNSRIRTDELVRFDADRSYRVSDGVVNWYDNEGNFIGTTPSLAHIPPEVPNPTPTPDPIPLPDTTPDPTPTSDPTPTPDTTPDPTPSPDTTPDPTPTPDQTPSPDTTPDPDGDIIPDSDPSIDPDTTSNEEGSTEQDVPENCFLGRDGRIICPTGGAPETSFERDDYTPWSTLDTSTSSLFGQGPVASDVFNPLSPTSTGGIQYNLQNRDSDFIITNNGESISSNDATLTFYGTDDDGTVRTFSGNIDLINYEDENGDSFILVELGPPTNSQGQIVPGSVSRYSSTDPNSINSLNPANLPEGVIENGVFTTNVPGSMTFIFRNDNGRTSLVSVESDIPEGTSINNKGGFCWGVFGECVFGQRWEALFIAESEIQNLNPITGQAISQITGYSILNPSPTTNEHVRKIKLKSRDAEYLKMAKNYTVQSSNYGVFSEKIICFINCHDLIDNNNIYVRSDDLGIVSVGKLGGIFIDYAGNSREVFDDNYLLLTKDSDYEYTSNFNSIYHNFITKNQENDLLFRLNREAKRDLATYESLRQHQELYYQNAKPASFTNLNDKIIFVTEDLEGYTDLNFFTYIVNGQRKLVLNRQSYNNMIELNLREDISIPVDTFVLIDAVINYNVERDLSISPRVYGNRIFFRNPDEVKQDYGEIII
ncbi:MAG: hypothetical protein ACMXYG_02645 [Candidatus Woesearchaeota archaeon]